jgi:hypothetical protein
MHREGWMSFLLRDAINNCRLCPAICLGIMIADGLKYWMWSLAYKIQDWVGEKLKKLLAP